MAMRLGKRGIAGILAVTVSILELEGRAFAVDYYWVGPYGGRWSDAANWSNTPGGAGGLGVPGTGDYSYIQPIENEYVVIDAKYEFGTVWPEMLRADAPSGSSLLCQQVDGSQLITGGAEIGINGTATYRQEGGLYQCFGPMTLGKNSGSKGIYELTDGEFSGFLGFYIGGGGAGTLRQTGGTLTATSAIYVGTQLGGQGYYELLSGTLNDEIEVGIETSGGGSGTVRIGDGISQPFCSGPIRAYPGGTVNMESGTVAEGWVQAIGGTFTMQGGTITTDKITSAEGGVFHQSGGHVALTGDMAINETLASSQPPGTYLLSGGHLSIAGTLRLTDGKYGVFCLEGTGTLTCAAVTTADNRDSMFLQEGGKLVTQSLSCGVGLGGRATYTLNGGELVTDATSLICSEGGSAGFIQNGGEHRTKSLTVGYSSWNLGGNAGYTLNDGKLEVETESIGSQAGYMAQTGGVHIVNKLTCNPNAWVSWASPFVLSGGTLKVQVEAGSGLLQTGGVHDVGTLTGTMELRGGSMKVGNLTGQVAWVGGTLSVETGNSLVNSAGNLSPGLESQIASNNLSSYTQSSTGSMTLEASGVFDYDRLVCGGNTSLAGVLEFRFLNGFKPDRDDVFVIITSGWVTGAFDKVNLPGYMCTVNYSTSSVTLSNFMAIPEPASLLLLGTGLIGLLTKRRCNSR